MRWEHEPWRKLYVHEPADQQLWKLFTRTLRDHLLRYAVAETGVIFRRCSAPAEDLCNLLRAHGTERDMVGDSVQDMLNDGYLEHLPDGVLRIRNMADAQTRKSTSAERKAAYRDKKKNGTIGGTKAGQELGQSDGTFQRRESKRIEEKRDPLKPPDNVPGESVRETARRAYGEGIRTVIDGPGFVVLDSEAEVLIRVIADHPRWTGLRAEQLASVIRKSAAEYATARQGEAQFEKGFSPTKWAEWLRAGGTKEPASGTRIATDPVERARTATQLRAIGDHALADKIEAGR